MATIKRTVSDNAVMLLYSQLRYPCLHASAAGRFQAVTKGSLILAKEIEPNRNDC